MKVISVINYKGGVGKTTITANLAAELAHRDFSVLAIDLDPQTNLTFSFMPITEWSEKYEEDKTIKYWFDSIIDNKKDIPSFTDLAVQKHGVDLICSHLGLIDVDIEIAAGFSSTTERQYKSNYLKTYSYIRKELENISDDYDVVLFDCPPNFSVVTRNALISSDFFIVPAKMDYLSTLGINQLRNHVNTLVAQYNKCLEDAEEPPVSPEFLGVIANMISIRDNQPIKAHQTYISQLRRNKIPLFDTMLRENKTLYADAGINQPVVLQRASPGSTYSQVIRELESLSSEFIRKTGLDS